VAATLNYGGIYFSSDGNMLNDVWSSSPGFQLEVLFGYHLTPSVSLSSGASLFFNRYQFEEQIQPFTDEQGEPTGDIGRTSMDGTVGTTYLGVPAHFTFRLFGNKSFYVLAGPELAFKVGHKNGTFTSVYEHAANNETELMFSEIYNNPENSGDIQVFINLGIGYSIDSPSFPLDFHLGAKQAVMHYMGGDNFINTWIRNFSFTAAYRF